MGMLGTWWSDRKPVQRGLVVTLSVLGSFALVLLAGIVPLDTVAAQGVGWTSPIYIQNIDSVDAQDVSVEFIDLATGNSAAVVSIGPITRNAAKVVQPATVAGLPSGKFSAVLSSDAKLAAVVRQSNGTLGGAYVGSRSTQAGSRTLYFPNIVRKYFQWHSPIFIQNSGQGDTTVTARFYRFSDGANVAGISKSLKAGQTWEIDPSTVAGLVDGTQYAVVASSTVEPLYGITNQLGTSVDMTYSGFSAGSTRVYLPNITRNYFDWNTPFIVQNLGDIETKVTATYYRFSDGARVGSDGPYALGAGKSIPFRPHRTPGLADGTQYSVIVDSTTASGGAGQPIVAVVNQERGTGEAMSYTGFDGGALTIYQPYTTRNTDGWTSPIVVQNIGNVATNVTARYYRYSDGTLIKSDGPILLGPGKSNPFRPHTTAGLTDGQDYSVVVESTAASSGVPQPIVSIVNLSRNGVDSMAYEGVKGD